MEYYKKEKDYFEGKLKEMEKEIKILKIRNKEAIKKQWEEVKRVMEEMKKKGNIAKQKKIGWIKIAEGVEKE